MTALNVSGLNLEGKEYAAYTAVSVVRRRARMSRLHLCTRADPYPVIGAALTFVLPVVRRSQETSEPLPYQAVLQ